jgi:L-alanine-DL-glutamate epimerase-like enolase superfamily enzyme
MLERLFVDPILPKNGQIELSDGPGYGLELNEKELPGLIADV